MKSLPKIAVIGGTGKSGNYLVQHLLQQGYHCKILVRHPDRLQSISPFGEVIVGDVTNYPSVSHLLNGCQAVISTLGVGKPPSAPSVFSTSTTHVLRAMQEHNVRRYVVITGLNVDTPEDKKSSGVKAATDWMYAHYPESTADKQKEYDLLRASSVDWTMIRLPLIEETDSGSTISVSLENCPGDKISATDLAHFLIEQLSDDTYIQQAPFVANR